MSQDSTRATVQLRQKICSAIDLLEQPHDYKHPAKVLLVEALALLSQSLPSAGGVPPGWRAALQQIRVNMDAGGTSVSNHDFLHEHGGALLDKVEEALESLSSPIECASHPAGENACDGKEGYFTAAHLGRQWVCTDKNCSWRRAQNPRGENDVDARPALEREARPAETTREQRRPENSRDSRRDGNQSPSTEVGSEGEPPAIFSEGTWTWSGDGRGYDSRELDAAAWHKLKGASSSIGRSEWVPVTERLPETHDQSTGWLVFDGENVSHCRNHPSWWNYKDDRGSEHDGQKVTHWMPIPKGPK